MGHDQHPPLNLFDVVLITEMDRLGRALEIALGGQMRELASRVGAFGE